MSIFDSVQEVYRDPSYSDHNGRGLEPLKKEDVFADVARRRVAQRVLDTYAWLRTEEAAAVIDAHRDEYMLFAGMRLVGHGKDYQAARKMAAQHGVSRGEEVSLRLDGGWGIL